MCPVLYNTVRILKKWIPCYVVSQLCGPFCTGKGFPGGSDGKVSVCMQETRAQSLGWEDLLEKEMATHSSILA